MYPSSHAIDKLITSASIKDYISLMKPRVMALVVFTSFCGMITAQGEIHPLIGFVAILCVILGAGGAAAINMWYDRDIDAIMQRTQNRPIITGAVNPNEALSFGVMLAVISSLLMALCVNLISSLLLVITILYYVFIYTMWLKRTSPQNVVIGGVSGALPPIIGSAAVTGNISLESITLFLIIFLWTPPHSWALALYRSDDYRNCNVPMMPVVRGEFHTKLQILFYTILMLISSFFPYLIGIAGVVYLAVALGFGCGFLYYAIALFKDDQSHRKAKTLFVYSIIYLFIIFFALLLGY